MKFEVPQFVDVEDKIFGPLTWKQFVYLAGGGGAGFILFLMLPLVLFLLVGGPVIAFAVGLAFYRVNNRPLSLMIESIFLYFTRGRLYLWKKDKVKETAGETAITAPTYVALGHNNINSLARSLEVKALNQQK